MKREIWVNLVDSGAISTLATFEFILITNYIFVTMVSEVTPHVFKCKIWSVSFGVNIIDADHIPI